MLTARNFRLILDNFQKINGNQETASYRIEHIAYREKLDLTKPADRLVAQQKAFAEDPVCMSATEPQTPRVSATSYDGLKRFARGAEHTPSALWAACP